MGAYENFKATDSYERFRRHNERLLKQRIRECQLWRTAAPVTAEDIARENALVIKRIRVWWGIDMEKEYAVHRTKPHKGDTVEEKVSTGVRVGVIDRILYSSECSTVSVKFGSEVEFIPLEEFVDYSSKGGPTRWFIT